jgi:alpha-L-rhamnosidase
MNKIVMKGQFIWTTDTKSPNQQVVFRKSFLLDRLPQQAIAHIAVDTKYWLYVNGELAVFEGGLFRESLPGSGYTDAVDLAPFLKPGENILAVHVQYFGNEGRNSVDSGTPCLLMQCDSLQLYSDESFFCMPHPAYYETEAPLPSYLYGGHNIGFDARKDRPNIYDEEGAIEGFQPAVVLGKDAFGDMYERPIPLIKLQERIKLDYTQLEENSWSLKLPYAMALSPCFSIIAKSGTVIDIRTDRYEINGGPGDNGNSYRGHRIEYICSEGENIFESLHYLYGEELLIATDKRIEIEWIGFRESGYDTEIVGTYSSSCEIMNSLVEKAARTLYVCMRDNFMDCPDRERGQWIGDVSVQIPQIFFLLSTSARALVKKAINDFINLRKEDVLVGNVPGVHSGELPAQSLNAISELGMIATYYHYTGDTEAIETAFAPCVRYLMLWDMGDNGLISHRDGDWNWVDHLHNSDIPVLSNTWYYSALKFARTMSGILDDHQFDKFINSRISSIEQNFNNQFWQGEYYSSNGVVDDRSNAMAVLVGLSKEQYNRKISFVLQTTFNASIYMEGYVLSALCEMGCYHEAYMRLRSRYYNLAVNENSTLWEDFFILGTKNHAWSGSPAMIAFKYFMGIDTDDNFKSYTVNPVPDLFDYQRVQFMLSDGKLVTVEYTDNEIRET